MTARMQIYPIHLLATGEVIDVSAKCCRDALARVCRVDAAVVIPWPDDHGPVAVIRLVEGHSVIASGRSVAAALNQAVEQFATCREGDS